MRKKRRRPSRRNVRWISFLLACALALGVVLYERFLSSQEGWQVGEDGLRIATWNMQWFPGRRPNAAKQYQHEHMARAQAALAQIAPDIFLINEVRDWRAAAELCEAAPGLQPQVVTGFREGNRPSLQQIAIASKWPAWSSWSESFLQGEADPPRGFAFAAIPSGDTLYLIYAVHLKSNHGDPASNIAKREEAARQLVEHARAMRKAFTTAGKRLVVVVGGDFNLLETPEFRSERTLAILESGGLRSTWEGVPFADRITWPGNEEYGNACFDYILISGNDAPKARVLPVEKGVSDHRPVLVVLPWGNGGGAAAPANPE